MRMIPTPTPTPIAAPTAAAPASAHVGPLGALAGHDHRIAGGALDGAILAGALAALRSGREGRGVEAREPEQAEAPGEGAEA